MTASAISRAQPCPHVSVPGDSPPTIRGHARPTMSDAPFDPDRIRNQAVAATGLDDWGDPSVHEGLEILCSSLRDEGNLNAKGAARLSSRILGAMIQRLKVIEDHKSIDGLSSVPIPRPIIVTGNGRSGTTLMHKLIAGCEGNRPVLTWEMR